MFYLLSKVASASPTYDHKVATAVALYDILIRNNLIDIHKTKQLYDELDDLVKYSLIGTKIGHHINKMVSLQTGSKAPYFKFSDVNGKTFTAKDFKGRTVLLHFWSSTCGPCRVENNEVSEFARLNKDVAVVNVSLDADKEKWTKAM